MKTMKIYDHGLAKPKRKHRFGIIRAGMAVVIAFGVGMYIGGTTPWANAETVKSDVSQEHIVEPGETVWDIARPISDAQGMDIREIIYQLQINNSLDDDCSLKPGQRLVIRY